MLEKCKQKKSLKLESVDESLSRKVLVETRKVLESHWNLGLV
jgi:hypothetical protein